MTNRTHGRMNRLKTHCPKGHPYDGENVRPRKDYYGRACRACERAWSAAWKARRKPALEAKRKLMEDLSNEWVREWALARAMAA